MRVTPTKVLLLATLAAIVCLLVMIHVNNDSSTYRDPRDCHSAKFGCTRRFPSPPPREFSFSQNFTASSRVEDSKTEDYSEYNETEIQLAQQLEISAIQDIKLDKEMMNEQSSWLHDETGINELAEERSFPIRADTDQKKPVHHSILGPMDNKSPQMPGRKQTSTACSVVLRDDELVRNCVSRSVIGKVPPSVSQRLVDLPREAPGDTRESSRTRAQSFQHVFDTRAWGHDWDPNHRGLNASGMGATVPWTQEAMATLHIVINEIKQVTGKLRVKMLDLPCGDMAWMSRFLKSRDDIDYTGIDIVPDLIENHKTVFKNFPWTFLLGDFVEMDMPEQYDLIFSRTLLQHLYMQDVFAVLGKISSSNRPGSYLLTTTWSRHKENSELEMSDDNPGRFRPLNLELPPLSLPPPLCLQRDGPPDAFQGWDHFLALWKLPLTQIKDCRLVSRFKLLKTDKDLFSCVDWSN